QVLEHRGPDGRGNFTDQSASLTLAHTRLAVIDLETGAQPLESEDGSIILVANGEIYDFERIRTSLELKGYAFRTKCDSEVILYLYKELGLDCFEQLRGEFAFLLYDRSKKLLIAARDRFGIKPLFFSRLSSGFVFASEMKAIFASGLVTPKLNAAGFDPLRDPSSGSGQLPFEGIEQVPPASYVAVNLETLEAKVTLYWSNEIPPEVARPITEPSKKDTEACAETVLNELEEAVRIRLRADVPVGLYLSGGIDSAFVAALMKRNLSNPPHSFSISFEGSDRNEQDLARQSADFIGTDHHELTVSKEMLWDNLSEALWFSELPFASLAPVGKFLLSKEARKYVTVVLTGEGADEVFLGYRNFFEKAVRDTRDPRTGAQLSSTQLRRLKLGAISRRFSMLIFHKRHRGRVRLERARANRDRQPGKPLINAVQEARIAAMPFDILCYLGDREEMAHSLEARLPFLDHKLYDAAKWIPVDYKICGGLEKAVLRDAANGILPAQVKLRRKSGFMLTSDAVDFSGTDRTAAAKFGRYLTRKMFEEAEVFSYRAYLAASFLSRLPTRSRRLRRLRRGSNKLIMYMMQTHMLHDMFVANPRWRKPDLEPLEAEGMRGPREAAVS
ncbi:MAG TPA: asparagine synthase (glutamine-hydrolyzing), partial [Sphingomicrobium sp.]|nr:asparagine synthase (glutamine-hydrolyzing) [Sphingomicrobium sp.]